MNFLREVKGYYNTLNRFNRSLVNFGNNLLRIEEDGVIIKKKFFFPAYEKNHISEIRLSELIDEEKEILHRSKVKLKVKKES